MTERLQGWNDSGIIKARRKSKKCFNLDSSELLVPRHVVLDRDRQRPACTMVAQIRCNPSNLCNRHRELFALLAGVLQSSSRPTGRSELLQGGKFGFGGANIDGAVDCGGATENLSLDMSVDSAV